MHDFPKPLGVRNEANEQGVDSFGSEWDSIAQNWVIRFEDDKIIFLQVFHVINLGFLILFCTKSSQNNSLAI
jgi:hypothetical protein